MRKVEPTQKDITNQLGRRDQHSQTQFMTWGGVDEGSGPRGANDKQGWVGIRTGATANIGADAASSGDALSKGRVAERSAEQWQRGLGASGMRWSADGASTEEAKSSDGVSSIGQQQQRGAGAAGLDRSAAGLVWLQHRSPPEQHHPGGSRRTAVQRMGTNETQRTCMPAF
jgi:hypothetical protein